MKSKLLPLAAGLTALSMIAGCSFKFGGIGGSGILKTESREVSGYSSISFKSVGNLKIEQTGKESLTISAEDNILPKLESRVSDKTLYISITNESSLTPTKPIEFVVEVKTLEGLNIDGVGNVEVKDIQGKRLSVSLNGAANMAIAGNVDVLDLSLSGVGNFEGEGLKTKQSKVQAKGAGNAVVNVSEQLDVSASGIGSIEYIGSPQVKKSVNGIGSVKKR